MDDHSLNSDILRMVAAASMSLTRRERASRDLVLYGGTTWLNVPLDPLGITVYHRPEELLACREWWLLWRSTVQTVRIRLTEDTCSDDADMRLLAKYPQLKSLVIVADKTVTTSHAEAFLIKLSMAPWAQARLQALQIFLANHEGRMSEVAVRAISRLPVLHRLVLDFSYFETWEAMEAVASWRNIRHLVITAWHLCDRGVLAIASLDQLQTLHISGIYREHVPVQRMKSLQELVMIGGGILQLPLPSSMKTLVLVQCYVDENGQHVLENAASSLETLGLYTQQTYDLILLPPCPNLKRFTLHEWPECEADEENLAEFFARARLVPTALDSCHMILDDHIVLP